MKKYYSEYSDELNESEINKRAFGLQEELRRAKKKKRKAQKRGGSKKTIKKLSKRIKQIEEQLSELLHLISKKPQLSPTQKFIGLIGKELIRVSPKLIDVFWKNTLSKSNGNKGAFNDKQGN